MLGEYDVAVAHHQEALNLYKDIGIQDGIAASIADLGDVCLAMRRYGEARERYQETLEILQRIDFQPYFGILFCKFGYLAVASGDHQDAQKRFISALEIGLDFQTSATIKTANLCLDTLPGVAALLAQTRETERAVEIAALAGNHVLSDPFTKRKAKTILSELSVQLPPEIFSAAQERGKSLDVEATAQELLKDLKN